MKHNDIFNVDSIFESHYTGYNAPFRGVGGARGREDDEGWENEKRAGGGAYNSKPVLKGIYFYNLTPEQYQEAQIYGMKQFKSGKYGIPVYDKSGASTTHRVNGANAIYGNGKWWEKKGVAEEGKGLWANIHAKQERIKHGSHEHMRKPGSKGAPTAKNFRDAASEGVAEEAAPGQLPSLSRTQYGMLRKLRAAIQYKGQFVPVTQKVSFTPNEKESLKQLLNIASPSDARGAAILMKAAQGFGQFDPSEKPIIDKTFNELLQAPLRDPGLAGGASYNGPGVNGDMDQGAFAQGFNQAFQQGMNNQAAAPQGQTPPPAPGTMANPIRQPGKFMGPAVMAAPRLKEQGVAEVSDKTLTSYLTKVDADSRKHKMDPTKRDPKKASKSVMGFSRAFNKLDSKKEQGVAQRMPKGGYSDEAHPIRDDGNEGMPGKRNYPGMQEADEMFLDQLGPTSLPLEVQSELTALINRLRKTFIFNHGYTAAYSDLTKALEKHISAYIKEETTDNPEYSDEVGYVNDNLHTIARMCKILNKTMIEDENLPDWVQEKISNAKGMLVAATDYLESQHEQGHVYTNSPEEMDEDWQKVNKHDKTDGMSRKAVSTYRREHPGSKLKTAVTKKPSELKAGSKDANRRKTFCARMSGVKGPMKDEHGKPTAKAKALSRWNCNEDATTESAYKDMFEAKLNEFASAGGTGGIATSMAVGNPAAGSLFGGSYSQKNSPFKKPAAKKRTGKMLKR